MTSISIYDDTTWELNYWIRGFLELRQKGAIHSLEFLRGRECPVAQKDRGWGSLTFVVNRGTPQERFAYIDIRDGYHQINRHMLEKVDAYFKYNFNPSYADQDLSADLFRKLAPLNLWFPIRIASRTQTLIEPLKAVRSAIHARRRTNLAQRYSDVRFLVRYNLVNFRLPRLEDVTDLSSASGYDWELYCRLRPWRSELKGLTERRIQILKILERIQGSKNHRILYGLMDSKLTREKYPEYSALGSCSRMSHLRTLSRSKIGIVTRGLLDSLGWGFAEHLATGTCVLAEEPAVKTAAPLRDGVHAVFFRRDLLDFEEKVRFYLANDRERERIARNGHAFFHQHCSPERQCLYLLEACKAQKTIELAAIERNVPPFQGFTARRKRMYPV